MKTRIIWLCLIIEMLCVSCQGEEPFVTTTLSPMVATPQHMISPSPVLTNTNTPSVTGEIATPEPTALVDFTTTENGVKIQCVNTETMNSVKIPSNGKVILNDQNRSEIVLLDMSNGNISKLDGSDVNISPDGRFMAYYRITTNTQKDIIERELIVSDANGQPIQMIPWEKSWHDLISWATDDRIVISLLGIDEDGVRKPFSILALNPFTGEQVVMPPSFSEMLYTPSTVLPYWDGWVGVVYDPSLSFAVYPRFVGDDNKKFTYGLWDVTTNELVISFDDVFSSYTTFNDIFPKPWWSPDGSEFVFSNYVISPERVDTELYSVNRTGQVEKLTHLAPDAYLFDSFSWSPNQRYIATYIYESGLKDKSATVAIFDTVSHIVINYCLPVTYGGDEYGLVHPSVPVWSPDSTQFLVVDWYEKSHRRVILVDIVDGFAVQIAEDMEPVGWMLAP